MIKVAVCGANGKMGQEVCNAVEADNSMKLAAKIDIKGNAYRSIEEAKKYAEFEVLILLNRLQFMKMQSTACVMELVL